MKITITAIFSKREEAELAASSLSAASLIGGAPGMTLNSYDHHAITAAQNLTGVLGALGDALAARPVGSAAAARGESTMLRVKCDPQDESFLVGELAAMGAEKISVNGR